MKSQILARLKHTEHAIPARDLARQLELAEVDLNRLITELVAAGHLIDLGPAGYRLIHDQLLPGEFPGREHLIHYREVVDSTMNLAREMAESGSAHGTVIIAGRQTRGRGRLTRTWESGDGGLYFTIILRPGLPVDRACLFNFAAALALTQAIDQLYGLPAAVKWPNDILVQEQKTAGILLETGLQQHQIIAYLNIGIGINVNNTPSPELVNATSLKKAAGRILDRKELLTTFLDLFHPMVSPPDKDMIIGHFRQMCTTIGRRVEIRLPGHSMITGTARSINRDGALEVLQADGTVIMVHYGDCLHHPRPA